MPAKGLLGPDAPPPAAATATASIDWPAFVMAARDTQDFIKREGRVPARVFVGPDPMPPADFLLGLARVWKTYGTNGRLPEGQPVPLGKNVELLTARQVAKDSPGLFGGWIIHKEGFQAPKVMEVARLQAWTLKPAIVDTTPAERK